MAMIETLKACLMFLGNVSLIWFVLIATEMAVMLLVQIIDEFRDRIRRKDWWEE